MVNVKKIVLASLALGLVNTVSAAMYMPPAPTVDPTPVSKNGFYAGIGLGALGFREEVTSSGATDSADGTLTGATGQTDNIGSNGLNSTLFVGYGWYLPHRIFLGLEANGNYTNTGATSVLTQTITRTTGGVTNSVNVDGSGDWKMKSVWGVRALPGYQVNDSTVAYGIIGFAQSRIDLNDNPGSISVDGSTVNYTGSSTGYTFNGYQVGIGSMTHLTEHVAIRGDIIYTGYESKTDTVTSAESSSSVTAKPSTVEGNVSLVYMFD
jgi:hypothetical protein